MKICRQSEWLSAGHSCVKSWFVPPPNFVEDGDRLVPADQDVVRIEEAGDGLTDQPTVPHRLDRAGPVVVAVPQEVGNAAAYLHPRKTVVQLRVVHNVTHTSID